ncbi:MAG: GspE/PulE family protein, partial [Phycisphaerales bacterium]|nr:GspE/PulE family protein [Phycisphaerales bacterium]
LVEQSVLTPRQVALVRAQICEVPFVDLEHYQVDIANARRMPKSMSESLGALPLFVLEETATVGMANPLDLRAVDQLRAALKCDVEPVLCEPKALKGLIDRAYALTADAGGAKASGAEFNLDLTTGKEPIVAAVNQIIAQAVEKGASDVHIGPDETTLHLRYRIDGELLPQQGPALSTHAGLVQRLKVMANLDLTQTRRPQDGKFRFNHHGRAVDIRLSIIPTISGENVVMRLLTSSAAIKGFSELGLPADAAPALEQMLESPYGMILVTGPTGSGKTTTLYTALKKLNSPDRNVMTIEDPVEIRLPLIRQVQVNPEIGMTFAGSLRSILRQDPDVVMVGEIRDEETARISVQAALTGHMVLSTLHTNDAPGAIPRLRDFGCPPFAINAAVLGVVAQRLVRRVCRDCARPTPPSPAMLAHFGNDARDGAYTAGAGCARCGSTGFAGRIGVYELLRLTQPVQQVIEAGGTVHQVRAAALANGYRPMWTDGLNKAKLGMTTLNEVARVVAIQATGDDETDVAGEIAPQTLRKSA